ncbi:MAG TPA: protein kinase [Polyangia bacterium]|nr:protein kinase [Polyangia bacterium]
MHASHAERVLAYLNEVQTGKVLNSRYLIEHQLGAGGMGAVYAARHVHLGTKLAIKVLLPELLCEAEAIERFDREARASAKIADENVVRILDVGQLENGAPYMVMEFLEGQDAAVYLKKHGRLSIEQAIDVMIQTCAAVAAAHAMGIIHRDIKPSNLFFVHRSAGRPLVKVLDFGVSKLVTADSQENLMATKTGSILGSPGYVSPEQWFDSKNVDKRSDIWALGIVLYELLTGKLPFVAASAPVLATKIAYEAVVPPTQLRPEIPADLEKIVLRCLEKKVEDRFQDVTAVAKALGSAQRRYQALNSSTANLPLHVDLPSPTPSPVAKARAWRPVSNRAAATALAGVLALVVVGGLLHKRKPDVVRPSAGAASLAGHPTAAAVAGTPVPASSTVAAVNAPPERPTGTASPGRSKATPAQRRSSANTQRARLASDGHRRAEGAAEPEPARCKPPYYFNAQGTRIFKVECL